MWQKCMMGLALCGRCLQGPRSETTRRERWGKVGWPIQLAHAAAAASHRAFGASQPSTSQPFPSRRPGQGQAGGIRCCCTSLLNSFPPTPAKAPLIRHAVGKSHRRRCLLEKCSSIQEFPQRMVGWLVDTLRDLAHRHFLSRPLAVSTDCTPCSAPSLRGQKTKTLKLGICIHSLPAPPSVPPDRLQTGQETTAGEKFLATSRFCWNALQSCVVQRFHVSWRVIDERRRAGGIVNCKISLCSGPGLGNGGAHPSLALLLGKTSPATIYCPLIHLHTPPPLYALCPNELGRWNRKE